MRRDSGLPHDRESIHTTNGLQVDIDGFPVICPVWTEMAAGE